MNKKSIGVFLFVLFVGNSLISAQETQPSVSVNDETAKQGQASQTQPIDAVQDKIDGQTQPSQTQVYANKKTSREFAWRISASGISSSHPWNSPARQDERTWQTAFTTGADMRGVGGFIFGQIKLAQKNPDGYFGTEIAAGKTLRKISGVSFGAGVRYWYANQKQEVASNNFWRVYAADKWHAGFFSVDAFWGRFNGTNARVSALGGSIYASTVSEIYSGDRQVGTGQLQKTFVPSFGGEISGNLRMSRKISLNGSVLYINAPAVDWSGRRNAVIPGANVFLFSGAEYVLPFKIFSRTAKTEIKSTFYVSKEEIPIVKRGIAVYFSIHP